MSPELQKKIEDFVNTGRDGKPWEGWTSASRCVQMAQLVLDVEPVIVVEVGVFAGRSLISQALALKQTQSGRIFGIDPWWKVPSFEGENEENRRWWNEVVDLKYIHWECTRGIWMMNVPEQAVLIQAMSQDVWSLFRPESVSILNIDGNHSEVASCRDVQNYLPLVAPGGYIWMDDCDWTTTKKAQGMLEQQCKVVVDEGTWKLYQKHA